DRARDPGRVIGAIPIRVLRQVLLVVVLGVVEGRRRRDLGGDPAEPGGCQTLLVGGAGCLGDALLSIVGRQDNGSILGPHVVALAVALARVVVLPEDLEELLVR